MKWEARHLSKAEKNAVADYLGTPDAAVAAQLAGTCQREMDPAPTNSSAWRAWGVSTHNDRFQTAAAAGLNRDSVQHLKLKWAFGFPGASATYSQPTVYGGKLFVGSEDGTVYALDSSSGCIWWRFKASGTVKTAVSVGNAGRAAFFGDTNGNVYAVKTEDGSLLWKMRPDSHPTARITGSPTLVANRLYVPVSSGEEGAAADPQYPCCTFRGSVVAVDTVSGQRKWKTYTITQAAKPIRKAASGVQLSGPSGASVWSPPTADLKRRVIYVATGNNYASPPSDMSDAVVALEMDSGRILWSRQFTPSDLWNIGCVAEKQDNCPSERGKDFDFGSPPLLRTQADGRDVLLLAQKSGIVYALDPDQQGKILWQARVARGGPLGGIEWGGAADARQAYYPVSDWDPDHPEMGGGLFALNLRTGKAAWSIPAPKPSCLAQFGCSAAQMAPPTAIPGVVFAGSLDGHVRGYDSHDGKLLWDFDTAHEFQTLNAVPARGGSLNGAGPTVVGGMVYVNSGYLNAMAGNVLLAFGVDGKR